ncbi:MAG: glycogen/starch/alpha-glucan phosphorylase [Gudongella sp.]|nr:glycogen/starch/alpha-glucan phosphorylase [Gudongella sp.]
MRDYTSTSAEKLQDILYQHGAVTIKEASAGELYRALAYLVRETLGRQLHASERKMDRGRVIVYLSMEHLPGLMLQKNLDYLGIFDELGAALKEHGRDIQELLAEDREPGLGSSDMGYLANGLMDTFASKKYNAVGYGLLYREGYFRQSIEDGQQVEKEDQWWSRGKNWLYKGSESFEVITGGSVDISKEGDDLVFTQKNGTSHTLSCYDLPYTGWENDYTLKLRLFESDSLTRRFIPAGTLPEDNRKRFLQEYILVSGAMQDIVRQHLSSGRTIDSIAERYLFLMLDSHMFLAIPEFLRILLDDAELSWNKAWEITKKVFYYAPIDTMEKVMAKMEGSLIQEQLPRLWMILEEIHHRYLEEVGAEEEKRESFGILWDDEVRLLNIAKAGAYQGPPLGHPLAVSHRRWLLSGNPRLRQLILEAIGDGFIEDPAKLKELSNLSEDSVFLRKLEDVKLENKKALSEAIFKKDGILTDPYAIFDGHIREISDDNRQLLQVLWVIDKFLELKDNPNIDVIPRVVLIGGKAAAHDYRSKLVIRLINSLSKVINSDPAIKGKLKLVFVEDLSQRRGELVIPSLELVQSLTVPSKEELHLGGLSSMISGAVGFGSRDNTNMLIENYSFFDSMKLFGSRREEVQVLYNDHDANVSEFYYRNKELKRACETLLGREGLFDEQIFRSLNTDLLKYNDHDFVLRDWAEYVRGMDEITMQYLDRDLWNKKSLGSIILTSEFASDSVVELYASKVSEEFD